MNKSEFQAQIERQRPLIEAIRQRAHDLHQSVGQTYDKTLPYSFHLDMVAQAMADHGHEVCQSPDDVAAMLFGAYFHDSIEDARLTYNNLLDIARQYLDEPRALMATEIVYALTNEKGRTRAERANDRYYRGIRSTPYAPATKLADRLANFSYSHTGANAANAHMLRTYAAEMPHFLEAIDARSADPRMALPPSMLAAIDELMRR